MTAVKFHFVLIILIPYIHVNCVDKNVMLKLKFLPPHHTQNVMYEVLERNEILVHGNYS